jgi:uncharacterized protein (DUF2147 family)
MTKPLRRLLPAPALSVAVALAAGAAAPFAAPALAQAPAAAPAAVPAAVLGRWLNPKRTAVVDTAPCGTDGRLCGTVACAATDAIEKAREKGTAQLVGTQLLERLEYKPKEKRWRGKVFVPDFPGRFDAIMTPISYDRVEVRGCILGGLICKKQMWTRIAPNSCETHLRVKQS